MKSKKRSNVQSFSDVYFIRLILFEIDGREVVKSRNEEKMPVRFLFMKQNEAAAKEKYSMKS